MLNRDLLKTPRELLGELDKQRLFLLRVEGTLVPCPAVKPQSMLSALQASTSTLMTSARPVIATTVPPAAPN